MNLYEACKSVAFAIRAQSFDDGTQYEPRVRAAIAQLEEEFGEKLIPADVALILAAPFNNAGEDVLRRHRARSNEGFVG